MSAEDYTKKQKEEMAKSLSTETARSEQMDARERSQTQAEPAERAAAAQNGVTDAAADGSGASATTATASGEAGNIWDEDDSSSQSYMQPYGSYGAELEQTARGKQELLTAYGREMKKLQDYMSELERKMTTVPKAQAEWFAAEYMKTAEHLDRMMQRYNGFYDDYSKAADEYQEYEDALASRSPEQKRSDCDAERKSISQQLNELEKQIDDAARAGANEIHAVGYDPNEDYESETQALLDELKAKRTELQGKYDALGSELAVLDYEAIISGVVGTDAEQAVMEYLDYELNHAAKGDGTVYVQTEYGTDTRDERHYLGMVENALKKAGYSREQIANFKATVSRKVNREITERITDGLSRAAKDNVLAAAGLSALSVGTNLLSGIGGVLSLLPLNGASTYSSLDPNSVLSVGTNSTNAIRGAVTDKYDLNVKLGGGEYDLFDIMYNGTMGIADSITAMGLGGGSRLVTNLIIGAEAAAGTMNDVTRRGGTRQQAISSGLAAGAFEALFEDVSIGDLKALRQVTPRSARDVVTNIAKSIGVNASEEALTEAANLVYDYAANGAVSNYELSYEAYRRAGYDEDDARKAAMGDMRHQVVEAALTGGFSGAKMSASANVYGYTSYLDAASRSRAALTAGDSLAVRGLIGDGGPVYLLPAHEEARTGGVPDAVKAQLAAETAGRQRAGEPGYTAPLSYLEAHEQSAPGKAVADATGPMRAYAETARPGERTENSVSPRETLDADESYLAAAIAELAQEDEGTPAAQRYFDTLDLDKGELAFEDASEQETELAELELPDADELVELLDAAGEGYEASGLRMQADGGDTGKGGVAVLERPAKGGIDSWGSVMPSKSTKTGGDTGSNIGKSENVSTTDQNGLISPEADDINADIRGQAAVLTDEDGPQGENSNSGAASEVKSGNQYRNYNPEWFECAVKVGNTERDVSRRVYQRDSIMDMSGENAAENIARMKRGSAPIGLDGNSVELHHLLQMEPGPLAEMLESTHSKYKQLHKLGGYKMSFRNDPTLDKQFKNFKRRYWKWRASQMED